MRLSKFFLRLSRKKISFSIQRQGSNTTTDPDATIPTAYFSTDDLASMSSLFK